MTRLAVAAAAALVLAAPALAARVHIAVGPASVHTGGVVTISAAASPCLRRDHVTLISRAIPGHAFGGEGAVSGPIGKHGSFSVRTHVRASLKPGRYVVSARCGGGLLNGTGTIRIR